MPIVREMIVKINDIDRIIDYLKKGTMNEQLSDEIIEYLNEYKIYIFNMQVK